eukprot:403344267
MQPPSLPQLTQTQNLCRTIQADHMAWQQNIRRERSHQKNKNKHQNYGIQFSHHNGDQVGLILNKFTHRFDNKIIQDDLLKSHRDKINNNNSELQQLKTGLMQKRQKSNEQQLPISRNQYLQSIYSIEHTNNDLQDLAKLNPENQIQDSSKVPPLDFPLDINSQNSQGIGINSARTQKLQAYRERLRSRQNKNELTMDIAIQSCRNLNTINVMDSFRRGSTSYNIQRSIYQRNQNSPYGSQDNESPIQKSKLPLFNQQLNTENSRSKTPNLTSQKFSQNRLSFDNLIDGINNGQSIRTFNVGENDANNQMKWTQSRIKSKIFTNNNKSQDFTINPVDSQGYDKFGLNIQDQNHIDPTKEFKHDSLFKRRQILSKFHIFFQ